MTQNKSFLIGLTVISSIAAFALSRVIWPDLPDAVAPVGVQLPLLIGISLIESVGFGIGIAFLVSLWSEMNGRPVWDWLTFISAAWLLISWWPHDNMHRVNMHDNMWGLIKIEWMFHFTLVIAGIIVASSIWKKIAMKDISEL